MNLRGICEKHIPFLFAVAENHGALARGWKRKPGI